MISADKEYEMMTLNCNLGKLCEWRKWAREIPQIAFPPDWLIRIIPPFSGAICRFTVANKENPSSEVSVYLDCYDILGIYGEPYWEIYPDSEGSNSRYDMNDTQGLLKAIAESFGRNSGTVEKANG